MDRSRTDTTDLDFKKVDQVIPIHFMVVEIIIVILDMVMVLVFKMVFIT